MSKLKESIASLIAEGAFIIIGWLVCVSILSGAFVFGSWAASHLGWEGNHDMFGLLSAIAIIWLYERRNMEERFEHLDKK